MSKLPKNVLKRGRVEVSAPSFCAAWNVDPEPEGEVLVLLLSDQKIGSGLGVTRLVQSPCHPGSSQGFSFVLSISVKFTGFCEDAR